VIKAKPETGTVLIIDDDLGVIEAYARMLRLEGYTVFTADNAEDGLLEAERYHPDAILLDLWMPLIDGLEFLQRLRAREAPRGTPVAIVTGDYFVEESHGANLHALGAEIIFKPLWLEDLVALTSRLLAMREARPLGRSGLCRPASDDAGT
jgi:DNA-binding response OmpR family regulator